MKTRRSASLWPKPPKAYGGRPASAAAAALFGNGDDPERAIAWLERCLLHPGQKKGDIQAAIKQLREWSNHDELKRMVEAGRKARRAKAKAKPAPAMAGVAA